MGSGSHKAMGGVHERTTAAERRRSFARLGVPEPIHDVALGRSTRVDLGASRSARRIGRFLVQRQIGRGGMGIVYEAIDRRVGRRLALKLVHEHSRRSTGAATDRLLREAQALARLNHPNIVSLYDFGTTEKAVYIAMEYVRGESLHEWSKQARTWRDVVGVFIDAGRGLSAAHAAGIVHRDFKPTNVLVGFDGRVKVLDFGLARSRPVGPSSAEASEKKRPDSTPDHPLLGTRLTSGGVIIGTTPYMSPEQLMDVEVGPASDQFSFCVALWEALYGERPYPGAGMLELAIAYKDERILSPRRKGIPVAIHRALVRGLQIRPSARFCSMDELIAALEDGLRPRRARGVDLALVVATASLTLAATLWTQRMWEGGTRARGGSALAAPVQVGDAKP